MKDQLLIEHWAPSDINESTGVMTQLVEAKIDSKSKRLYIEGIFLQAEVVNRNGRIYPKRVLEKAVDKYIREQVKTHQALGEFNHPAGRPFVDPTQAAIRIEELWWEGNNVMGRAVVLEGDGAVGDKLAANIRGGWIPGVSSRGLGSVKDRNGINEVQEGYRLTVGVDVVWGPSAPQAYVKSFTESTETIIKPASQQFNECANGFEHLFKALEKLV